MSGVKDTIKQTWGTVKGTCGEAKQNSAYDELVMLTNPEVAEKLVQPELEARGITIPEWRTYRKVKTVIQRDPPPIARTVKDLKRRAARVVDEELLA